MLISAHPAQGTAFSLKQNGFSGEPFVSGTFSGEDINHNNILERHELNSFKSKLAASSVFSVLVIYYYLDLNDNPFAVADGRSNQPVVVRAVPEPLTIGGAIVAGLLGTSFRKKLESHKAKRMPTPTPIS